MTLGDLFAIPPHGGIRGRVVRPLGNYTTRKAMTEAERRIAKREQNRAYCARNREKKRAARRAWYQRNKAAKSERSRLDYLRRKAAA